MQPEKVYNGVIRSAYIGFEDHGMLTSMVYVELDYGTQGFGGYVLENTSGGPPNALEIWVRGILRVAGCRKWHELEGRPVRVRGNTSLLSAMGNYIKEDWFVPAEAFAKPDASPDHDWDCHEERCPGGVCKRG